MACVTSVPYVPAPSWTRSDIHSPSRENEHREPAWRPAACPAPHTHWGFSPCVPGLRQTRESFGSSCHRVMNGFLTIVNLLGFVALNPPFRMLPLSGLLCLPVTARCPAPARPLTLTFTRSLWPVFPDARVAGPVLVSYASRLPCRVSTASCASPCECPRASDMQCTG